MLHLLFVTELLQSLILIAGLVIVFILLRSLILWYWKVDTIVTELHQMNATLLDIIKELKNGKA